LAISSGVRELRSILKGRIDNRWALGRANDDVAGKVVLEASARGVYEKAAKDWVDLEAAVAAAGVQKEELTKKGESLRAELAGTLSDRQRLAVEAVDRQVEQTSERLANGEILIGGRYERLGGDGAKSLLNGGKVRLGDREYDLATLAAEAKVKTSLTATEQVAQLNQNQGTGGVSLTWSGGVTFQGTTVTGKDLGILRALAKAEVTTDANGVATVAGVTLSTGGKVTMSKTLSQVKDLGGRVTSSEQSVVELTGSGGVTTGKSYTVATTNQRYDAKGQVIGYERRTRDVRAGGIHETLETMKGAVYDAAGRMVESETHVRETAGGKVVGEYDLTSRALAFDASGRAVRWERTKSAGEEIGRASCRKECRRLCRSRWSPYH
jgi:hypothetical protein